MDEKTILGKCDKMMNSEKMKGDYERTREVILSCQNMGQLRVGIKMYNQLNKLHELPEKDLDKLENLIGLMRIKCRAEDMNEERSSIGQEFHGAAQRSNVQVLKNIVFSEEEEFKGGEADKMSPKDLADKHNVDVKEIEKEIRVGTKIEMEHTDSKKLAKEIAMDHIAEFADYYTDPEYGIIAIEDKKGENKKTIRISKSEMEKLHNGKEVSVDGVKLSYRENVDEDLDSNRISRRMRRDFRDDYSRRESPKEFDQLRKTNDVKPNFDDLYIDLDYEEEIDEATSAMSSGSFVPPLGGKTIRRTFKKSEIPVSVDGLPKGGINKPIGSLYSFNEDKEVLEEEEELGEGTSVASVGGQYITPKFWAKGKGNWRNRVKKAYPGGKFVNIKKKCKNYPYCDQGSGGPSGSPITLSDTSDMEIDGYFNESRVVKTIKKGKLKIKR
jgi:hypothetical protein